MTVPRPIVSRRAQQDLRRIWRYVAGQGGGNRAGALIDRILALCALFATQPQAGQSHPELGRGVRSCAHGAYLVFYRARGTTIEIVRVIHGRRDVPAAWDDADQPNRPP